MKSLLLSAVLALGLGLTQVYAQMEQTVTTADTMNVKNDGAFRRFFNNIKENARSVNPTTHTKYVRSENTPTAREFQEPHADFSGDDDSLQIKILNENLYGFNPSSRLMRELKDAVIVAPKTEKVDTLNILSPERLYNDVEGLTIRKITIVQHKPFSASVNDSVERSVKWTGKVANALHIDTREFIVRNMLLFREGDLADGFKLAHSERYLRSFGYINDARIVAVPVSDNEADVIVVVQDVFPYSADFSSNFSSTGDFSIINNNIIGVGLEMKAGAYMDTRKEHLMGYQVLLRSSNIGRTFTTFQAEYLDKYENQRYGFSLQRDFYSPTTKYAGHLMFQDARTQVRYHDPVAEYLQPIPFSIRYNLWDAWFGRSFSVIDKFSPDQKRMNLTASLRAQRLEFTDRPAYSEERYYRFQSRTKYLASLSWSQQMFYKTSMMYNFGRAEDIPYGEIITLTGGREINEKYSRTYLGVDFATGYFVPKIGYVMGAFSFGTFFRNKAEQGVIDFQMKYITNIATIGKYRLRTFINGRYTGQLFNNPEDRLIIDGEHGIPGFSNDTVLGRHRFNLSVEQCLFTPLNIYEFRFVVYAFARLSWLDDYNKPIILSNMYSSFGVGLRIRNNRLTFKTIQIEFAYFHNTPKPHHFNVSGEDILRPRQFRPVAPDVMAMY